MNRSPYANTISIGRKLLPKAFMEHMPFRKITDADAFEVMSAWDYNPTYFYPKGLKKRKNEVGHNAAYRFILTPDHTQGEQ